MELEHLLAVQLVKKFIAFMETAGSPPCSQQPTTDPYLEPDDSRPHTSIYLCVFEVITFLQVLCASSFLCHICYIPHPSPTPKHCITFQNTLIFS
jgi:hypothetical protein